MIKKSPIVQRKMKWYGRRSDLADPRDLLFSAEHAHLLASPVPSRVDLRAGMPPVYDQLALGSCVGNGVGGAFEYEHHRQGRKQYKPARLFIYYGARDIEGSIKSDSGCEIRDGIKVAAKLGVPHETLWPYKISKFASKPSPRAFTDAANHVALKYERISNDGSAEEIIAALAAGYPVIIGFTVFASFEDKSVTDTGIVPMPQPDEAVLGGHCMLLVGYEKDQINGGTRFIARNSWSADWGDKGYCYMPEAYLIDTNLADDFWIIESVE